VILDYIRKRNISSISLLEEIKENRIRCYTSYYTLFELIDSEQENKWIWKRVQEGETLDDFLRHRYPRALEKDELRAVFKSIESRFLIPFVKSGIVQVVIPESESWDSILKLLQKHNFSLGDAFQFDTAVGIGCNVFLTRDSDLAHMINELRLKVHAITPADVDKRLKELGFDPLFPT
jgi:predicted nucleic acid-binding protein